MMVFMDTGEYLSEALYNPSSYYPVILSYPLDLLNSPHPTLLGIPVNASVEKRLNKFISESGFCSRREADRLVEQNRVTINGKLPELGTKVLPGDDVRVDGKTIHAMPEDKTDRVYIAYNKPIGITCTTESRVKGNIIDAVKHPERVFPIGRLDKPSEGLIFLTSDGDIVNKILRAENAHDKEYIVTVDKPLTEDFVRKMSKGVPILDTITKPCEVWINSRFVFTIILTQGLNRQIRRMAEYLGYNVTKLKRTRIMNVHLTGLKVGEWRNLTQQEMDEINGSVSGSIKTSSIQGERNARHLKTAQSQTVVPPNVSPSPHARPSERPSERPSTARTRREEASRIDKKSGRKVDKEIVQKKRPKLNPKLSPKLTHKPTPNLTLTGRPRKK